MIHHLSIAARDPKQAAAVLAELMGGTAVPFPPNPGSFFALQLDDHGSGVEVYPAGTQLEPNGATVGLRQTARNSPAFGATHCAISVPTDAAKVAEIAKRAGWQCFDCNRGPFHVIEVWIENETMIEILPADIRQRISGLYAPRQRARGDGERAGVCGAPTLAVASHGPAVGP